MEISNFKYKIRYGVMPKYGYLRNKLLYNIWVATNGTGVMPLYSWAYCQRNGKVYRYKNFIQIKPIPPVLKVVSKDDDDLTPEAKALFTNHEKMRLALQYIGNPDELVESVKFIESRKI